MEKVLFVMLLLAHNVFANHKDPNLNCDECIKTGGTWCHSSDVKKHCITTNSDFACPDVEILTSKENSTDGDLLRPQYAETTLYINDFDYRKMMITYTSSVERNVTVNFLKPDEMNIDDPKINVQVRKTVCDSAHCTVHIYAKVSTDFCYHFDFMDVIVKVEGFADVANIRYHVPCSCECSKRSEIKSNRCNNRGNFTCGICSCEGDWQGNNCDKKCTRGDQDLTQCKNIKNDKEVVCSGNGICECDECTCFENREGSQYFDPSELCSDVCMQTIECDACLRNGTLGECRRCDSQSVLSVIPLNETVATTERDYMNRLVWVYCQEVKNECHYNYYAMRTEEQHYAMVKSTCNDSVNAAMEQRSNVPVILGVLAVIAMIATVGGIMLWKHMNALPPLPMADPQYANIDAEDCTGENPLYKPPTSSFKNPTYGKW